MSFKDIPDWSQPLRAPGGDLYFACEDPLRLFAPPLELRVAKEANGAPALSLERMRLDGGPGGPTSFGLLTIRFASHFAIADRQRAVFAAHSNVRVEPLFPRGGFLRFEAAGLLEVPDALLKSRPLVWSGAGSFTFAAQLGDASTSLLHDALTNGLLIVTALAEVEMWGVASRVGATVTFNPAALARSIAAIAVNGQCSAASVASLLASTNDTREIVFTGVDSDAARAAAAEACTERLIGRFARLAPADVPAGGAVWAFDTAAMDGGEMVWELSERVLVPKAMSLGSNPLDAARKALEEGFTLTADAPVTRFESGLHVLTVYPNLPARRVGVLMLSAEVRVPPHPPERPQTVIGSAVFRDGSASKTIAIRLSPAEPMAFDYHTVAFVTENGGARRLEGPLLHHEGRHLTISSGSFPVQFLRVEATSALLDVAMLHVRCSGERAGVPWSVSAELDTKTNALAFAVPLDLTGGAFVVTATAVGGGRTLVLARRALEDCWLDLSSFPTAGPQRLEVVCEFDDDAGVVAIECVPEDRLHDADAVGLIRLTPANAAREWRWLVTNPLRDGVCWRWFTTDDVREPWSAIVDPGAGPLTLKSSTRLHAGVVQ
jgi:hypothetical protein